MSDDTMTPPAGSAGVDRQAWTLYDLLNQGKRWLPNGKPAVAIADMDPEWRHNTAAFLVRHARSYLIHYDFGELIHIAVSGPTPGSMAESMLERGMEEDQAERAADPEAWIKTTPLYKALIKGLPKGKKKRAALAEAARHWSYCPVRTDKRSDCVCASRQAELSAGKAAG